MRPRLFGIPVREAYLSVSRLPWLSSRATWSAGGTWTRGLHFVAPGHHGLSDEPDHGDLGPLRRRYGLAATRTETFSVEGRTGWIETEATPERKPPDHWDEARADAVVMHRPRPVGSGPLLTATGRYAAFRDNAPAWGELSYSLGPADELSRLGDVQWADRSGDGKLLVATTDGRLQVRDVPYDDSSTSWERDVSMARPVTTQPPPEASEW